jgi:hypothetical protein
MALEREHAVDRAIIAEESLSAAREIIQELEQDAGVTERITAGLLSELQALRGSTGLADRALLAEKLAAASERRERELHRLIHGTPRQFTTAEMNRLRSEGPAGEAILGRALQEFTRARKREDRPALRSALVEIAKAAVTWSDRL